MVAVLFLLAFITLLSGYSLWRLFYWRRKGVQSTRSLLLCGDMLQFLLGRKHYGLVYEEIYKAHPKLPYVGIQRIFNEPVVLLRSQDLIKEAMVSSFQHFQDNVLFVNPHRDPIVLYHPFMAKGGQWRQLRAEFVPIFTPNKVKSSFVHIKSICEKLDAYVTENLSSNCFEAKNLFSKYTLDVVASAGFSLDGQSFTNNKSDFTQLVKHLFLPNSWSLIETIALLFSPAVGNLISYRYMPSTVQNWLNTIIGSVLKQRLQNETTHKDFLQWLIEAKQKQNEPLDRSNIVGHCSTILLESFETSSSLMAFTLYELATNQDIQNRVLQEIDEVLARHNGEVTFEALHEMTYFEATLFESLRLYPAMPTLLKICTKSFELPSQRVGSPAFKVPEGMILVIPVKAIHYDPEIYSDPLQFQPERFASQRDRQQLGCQFLGFGEGPRMCPGMRFALAQSKAGLVTLLSKYSVHLAKSSHGPLKLSPTTFLTVAKDGIWISFKRRQVLS